MKKMKQTNMDVTNNPRATVLVLVVVLVALLAIMGTTFVITSHINLQSVKNQVGGTASESKVNGEEIERSVDSAISQIQTTLSEDLWGRPENASADSTTNPTAPNTMNAQRLLGLPADSNNAMVIPTDARYNGTVALRSNNVNYFLNEPWDAPVRFLPGVTTLTSDFSYYNGGTWATSNATVDGDPWLASSSLKTTATQWAQGSDIFLVKFTNPNTNVDTWPVYGGSSVFSNISAVSLAAATTTDDQKEMYADADGDGVLDSVWLYQKGFFNEYPDPNTFHYFIPTYADMNGDGIPASGLHYCGLVTDLPIKSSNPDLTYRMAVRIVDTSGMVNVNTAWAWPGINNAGTLDYTGAKGNSLGGAMMYGNGTTAYGPSFGRVGTNILPGRIFSISGTIHPSEADLLNYQNSYIYRIENPDWSALNTLFNDSSNPFYPLDISDEMELRYKWVSPGLGYKTGSLTPGSRSTLETRFTDLYGDANADNELDDDAAGTYHDNIFNSHDAAYDDLKKRTLLTSYSFSRNIRTKPFMYPTAEAVTDFDGRMKNLNRAVYSLVYRIKNDAGTGTGAYYKFPGSTVAERTANATLAQQFVQIIYHAFLQDTKQTHYADEPTTGTAISPVQQRNYARYHTWQYIANLVDYLDDDDDPTVIDTSNDTALMIDLCGPDPADNTKPYIGRVDDISFDGDYKVYGLEKHAVISEVVVRCEEYKPPKKTEIPPDKATYSDPQARYSIAVEQYNPWNETVKSAKNVKIYYITDETGTDVIHPLGNGSWNLNSSNNIPADGWVDITLDNVTSGKWFNEENTSSTNLITIGKGGPDISDPNGAGITSSYNIRFLVVVYRGDSSSKPEDVFLTTTATLPTGVKGKLSFERHYVNTSTTSPWAIMVNDCVPAGNGTLGSENTTAITSLPCNGYVTVTVKNTPLKKLSDVWCDDTVNPRTLLWNENPAAATSGHYFAKLRNLGDLLAVPYVGYCRDLDGIYKGIGDWLQKHTDATLRFDLSAGTSTPPDKGATLRNDLLSRFTITNRENDGIDQLNKDNDNNTATNPDDIDEMRLPGLINVNTSSWYQTSAGVDVYALDALHPLMNTNAIGRLVVTGTATTPYKSASDFVTNGPMPVATTDINILNLSAMGANQDILQQEGLFTRYANLITTRSDTFVAYIYVQALDKSGNVAGERREMVLLDRSLCNQPPLKWDATAATPCWITNPEYRPVKVVSRMTVK